MPVVILTGPRQSGKSTLAQNQVDNGRRRYRSLDDFSERAAAQENPAGFVHTDQPLTIDEVQRAPDLLLAIKREIDRQRTRRVPGRYLLTGSANLLLLRTVADSLSGRASYVTLWPMTRRERLGLAATGMWTTLLETPPERWERVLLSQPAHRADWRAEVRRGGFPVPSVHMESDAQRAEWFDGYIQTYLERDFTGLSAVENLLDVRALMRATALRIGNLVNQTELGRDIQMSQPRVRGYLNLLETSYQLVRLAPFTRSRTTRLIKTPKAYWNDPGLALHLSGQSEPGGAHFENMILLDLLAWRSTATPRPDILYWRNTRDDEVDFVIETARQLLPIEAKSGRTVAPSDVKGMVRFLEDNRTRARAGVVLSDGSDVRWLAPNILVAPWWMVL